MDSLIGLLGGFNELMCGKGLALCIVSNVCSRKWVFWPVTDAVGTLHACAAAAALSPVLPGLSLALAH